MARKQKTEIVRIYNCSKQLISIQVRPPKSDFYRNEQQVRILPGVDVLLPKSHLMEEQISNLQKRGMIRVIYDSEVSVMESKVTP